MLSAKLVVVGGDAKKKEVNLRLPTIIGRGREGVSLTLPHKLVSRKHTELFERDGKLFVKDLGSLNGTFVNNQRIEAEQLLEPNQLLTLGNVTFRAVYELAVPTTPDPVFEEVSDPSDVDLGSESGSEDSTTDKSLVDVASEVSQPAAAEASSDIFDGPAIEGVSPEKSISISALGGLPVGHKESFSADVSLEGLKEKEQVQEIDFRVDDAVAEENAAADPKLGSFLKKMPR